MCATEYSKRGGCKQFTAGLKNAACVVSQRKTDIKTDLKREINNFVKRGDENSPQVLFDQVQRYTVFRKAAVFTSSWKHLSLRLHILYCCLCGGAAQVKLWAKETNMLTSK